MIDKKELRAGNIVNVPHGDAAIAFLMQEGVHLLDDCGGNWQSLEPVPISNEYLEQFGFRSDIKDWYWLATGENHYIAKNPHGFYLSITDPDDESVGLSDKDEFATKLNIEYVHQLQNLYFALTGQELTLKP